MKMPVATNRSSGRRKLGGLAGSEESFKGRQQLNVERDSLRGSWPVPSQPIPLDAPRCHVATTP